MKQEEKIIKYDFNVVIPVYKPNMELFKKCILSVKAQTHDSWIIVLSFDGPNAITDDQFEELKSFLEDEGILDRVFSFTMNQHSGCYQTRTRGWRGAAKVNPKGKYLLSLDCDDTLDPNIMHALFKANHREDIIEYAFTEEGYNEAVIPKKLASFKDAYQDKNYPCSVCCKAFNMYFIRRLIYEKKFPMIHSLNYGEDVFLSFLMSREPTSYRTINNIGFYYRRSVETSIINQATSMKPRLDYIIKLYQVFKDLSTPEERLQIWKEKNVFYFKMAKIFNDIAYIEEKEPGLFDFKAYDAGLALGVCYFSGCRMLDSRDYDGPKKSGNELARHISSAEWEAFWS